MAQVVDGKISEVTNAEVVIERPEGSRVTVIVNIRPLKNQRGEITGAINCFYDITQRQRMEHKLQQQTVALADLHRRKDEFLAMLSHELRSPLAPIANAVHLLRLQLDESKLQQQASSDNEFSPPAIDVHSHRERDWGHTGPAGTRSG